MEIGNRLQNKTAIVFGGSGDVGPTVCRCLAAEGAKVVVHYFQRSERAEAIAKDICQQGGQAIALGANCTDLDAVKALAAETKKRFGSVDIVVNLVYRDKGWDSYHIVDNTWDDWSHHIDAMKSHFFICKATVPYMREQHFGRIIFMSGGLVRRFIAGNGLYSSGKAGINAFSKCMAREEGKNNITVNIVAPGCITVQGAVNPQKEGMLAQDETAACPLGHFATAEEVASTCLFFASPDADGITGQTIYVAGGEIMPMP